MNRQGEQFVQMSGWNRDMFNLCLRIQQQLGQQQRQQLEHQDHQPPLLVYREARKQGTVPCFFFLDVVSFYVYFLV